MTGLVLVAERYRQVTARDEAGRPTGWRWLNRGDSFTPVDDTELARLMTAGAVRSGDDASVVDAVQSVEGGAPVVEAKLPSAPRKTGTTEEWRRYAIALHSATGGDQGLPADAVADLGRNDIIELLEA